MFASDWRLRSSICSLVRHTFTVLMLPVTAPTVLKDENIVLQPRGLEQATEVALAHRSDLKASQDRIRQQEYYGWWATLGVRFDL